MLQNVVNVARLHSEEVHMSFVLLKAELQLASLDWFSRGRIGSGDKTNMHL